MSLSIPSSAILYSGHSQHSRIVIAVDPMGSLIGIIVRGNQHQSIPVTGIPSKVENIHDLVRATQLLQQRCQIRLQASSIDVVPRLRGGGKVSMLLSHFFPRPPEPEFSIPSFEKLYKSIEEHGAASAMLTGGLYGAARSGNPYVAGAAAVVAAAGAMQYVLDKIASAKFERQLDILKSQTASNTQKLEACEQILKDYESQKSSDWDRTEKYIAAQVAEMDHKQLQGFVLAASDLLNRRSPKAGNAVYRIGTFVANGVRAIRSLQLPISGFGQIGAFGTLLTSGVAALSSFLQGVPQTPVTEALMRRLSQEIKDLDATVKDGLRNLERTQVAMYHGLTKQLESIQGRQLSLESLAREQFACVRSQLQEILLKMDKQTRQILSSHLLTSVAQVGSLTQSTCNQQKYGDYVTVLATWAREQAKFDVHTGYNAKLIDLDKCPLNFSEICAHIGFFRYHSRVPQTKCPKKIVNPLLWGIAVDGYLALRTRGLRNKAGQLCDYALWKDPGQIKLLEEMINRGQEIEQFVTCLQESSKFFDVLIDEYRVAAGNLRNPSLSKHRSQNLAKLQSAYLRIHGLIQLGFSRSCRGDLFLTSLLSLKDASAHRLLNRQEVEKRLLRGGNVETLWENLMETADLLKQCLDQKIKSLGRGKTSDQFTLVSAMVYKLCEYESAVYAKPMRVKRDLRPCHVTNVNLLCKGKPFLAAKLGVTSEVLELLKEEKLAINQRNPYTGRTVLHEAAEYGHKALVQALLAREGIQVFVADDTDQTPFDVATGSVQAILRQKMNQQNPIGLLGKGEKRKHLVEVAQSRRIWGFHALHAHKNRAFVHRSRSLEVYDLESGRRIKKISVHGSTSTVRCQRIAVLRRRGWATCYDLDDPSLKFVKTEPIHNVVGVDLVNNRLMGVQHLGRGHNCLLLADLSSGKTINKIQFFGRIVYPNYFHYPDVQHGYTRFITVGQKRVESWDLKTCEKLTSMQIQTDPRKTSVWGDRIAVLSGSHTKVYNLVTEELEFEYQAQLVGICKTAQDYESDCVLYKEKVIAPFCLPQFNTRDYGVWDIKSKKLLYVFRGVHPNLRSCRQFIHTGKAILRTSPVNGQTIVYDLDREKEIGRLTTPGYIQGFCMLGEVLAIGDTKKLTFWDTNTRKEIYQLEGNSIRQVVFSGNKLVTLNKVDRDHEILRAWELRDNPTNSSK